MKISRLAILFGCVAALLALTSPTTLAQCAMCKAVLENSTDAAQASKGLNLAAIVLLVPPVTLFSGLFYAIYRFRDVQGHSQQSNPDPR